MLVHAFAWLKSTENIGKWLKKVPFPSCIWEAHVRRMKKNKEKSLLVSDWEWLPKAGWHPKSGFSFGFLSFFFMGLTWASRTHDGKDTFFIIFLCLRSFLNMRTHVQACVPWSKYTTCNTTQKIFYKCFFLIGACNCPVESNWMLDLV